MKKVRKTLPIVIPAFVILGILAVSGHAKKPPPRPEPTVAVTGGIEGEGDPAMIRITFADSSFVDEGGYPPGSSFISNPDGPPSLRIFISTTGKNKALRYYYCTHNSHVGPDDLICDDTSHNPDYYYCLRIGGGISQKKGRAFDHVVFPVGSPWIISWKKDNSIVASGTLSTETRYDVIE